MRSAEPTLRLSSPPDEVAEAFRDLRTLDDLARLLELPASLLPRYAFGRGRRYRSFQIKKRRGGKRTIWEPAPGLRALQRKLAQVFDAVFRPRDPVHGFVAGRSIATNAFAHINCDWVLNVDLKDFFPTINFGRVRGLLIAAPYDVPASLATVIARLCTFQNQLPQGSPASPVLSNMIAAPLDSHLRKLALRYKCSYTRYADDLTFSRNGRFPSALAQWDDEQSPERLSVIGPALEKVIVTNGFQSNAQKTRLQHRDERQIVTGLVVNELVNVPRLFVSRIRAMLHAWEVYGLSEAEREHREKYDDDKDRPHGAPAFTRVVKGHIDFLGMVRGKDHRRYQEFIRQYAALDGDYRVRPPNMYRPNHLRTWRDAVWVVETEEMQGTAFQLEGVGFVTCAHVLADEGSDMPLEARIYHPRNPAVNFGARVVRIDVDNDVAILTSDAVSGVALKSRTLPASEVVGAQVKAAGYPRHAKGASLWEEVGVVTLTRHFEGRPRYIVNMAIVAGASGSPVMDLKHCVVGMATTGVAGFRTAASKVSGEEDHPDYGVIPVSTIVGHS